MAGLATETVSRTLTDFKEKGLIKKKDSQISIINLNRTTQMKN